MTHRIVLMLALLVCSGPAFAQQRPLQTEDPESIGAGRVLIESGIEYRQDASYPVSGLRGNMWSLPSLGVSVGISSIAEIQIDGGLYQRLDIKQRIPGAPFSDLLDLNGSTTSGIDDLNIGAKIKFLSETAGRPAMAFRFSTRLPNAPNESGFGKDMQDFSASLIFGKTIQSIRVVTNVGMLILGNPTTRAAQDDLLTYSLSVARAITPSAEFVGEFAGRANFAHIVTPGAEDRGAFRLGTRYTAKSVRLDAGILMGLTLRDPDIGFSAGFTWVFDAFKIP